MKLRNHQNLYLKKTRFFVLVLLILASSCTKKAPVKNSPNQGTPGNGVVGGNHLETVLYTIKGDHGVELSVMGVGSKVFVFNSKPGQALGSGKVRYKIISKFGDKKEYAFDSSTPFGKRVEIPLRGAIQILKNDIMLFDEKYDFNEYWSFCYELGKRWGYFDNAPTTSGVGFANTYWPRSIDRKPTVLRVKFMDADPSVGSSARITELQDGIITAAKVWEQYANIHFKRVGLSEDADIRIKIVNGLDPTHNPEKLSNNSQVGTAARAVPRESPTMLFTTIHKITDKKYFNALVQHETGHALGLLHEQSHSDAKINFRVVTIAYIEIHGLDPEKAEVEAEDFLPARELYKKRHPNSTITIDEKSYDPLSIMHYEVPAFATFNNRAINRGKNNMEISEGDKIFIRTIYPFPN